MFRSFDFPCAFPIVKSDHSRKRVLTGKTAQIARMVSSDEFESCPYVRNMAV